MWNLDVLVNVRGGRRLRDWLLRYPRIEPDRPRAHWFRRFPNFGDQLSKDILRWVLGTSPTWVSERFTGKILAVGSILPGALAENDIVWGSGAIDRNSIVPPAGASFLAVRGPLTRTVVKADVPEVYGDPALLLPLFYTNEVKKGYRIGVVPHYHDRALISITDPAILVIDVANPWTQVVDAIRSSEVVLSSSLHGLIVAEAYGIPASWIRISDRLKGGSFKFNDYYLATGRAEREPTRWNGQVNDAVRRIAQNLEFNPQPLLDAAKSIPPIPT
jgi:pyruvyltransferase